MGQIFYRIFPRNANILLVFPRFCKLYVENRIVCVLPLNFKLFLLFLS